MQPAVNEFGTYAVQTRQANEWFQDHVSELSRVMSDTAFEHLCVEILPALTGHRAMLAAMGRVFTDKCEALQAWNFGCPDELFARITRVGTVARQPTLMQWREEERPLFLLDANGTDPGIAAALTQHGLECRAVHCVGDGGGSLGSCFTFFGLDPRLRARVTHGLRLVVPHLHVALIRLCKERSIGVLGKLTARERQLVQLIVEGHSNPEIARQWNRSVATVRNLLHGLMGKLGVDTRARLVAIAVQAGWASATSLTSTPESIRTVELTAKASVFPPGN